MSPQPPPALLTGRAAADLGPSPAGLSSWEKLRMLLEFLGLLRYAPRSRQEEQVEEAFRQAKTRDELKAAFLASMEAGESRLTGILDRYPGRVH